MAEPAVLAAAVDALVDGLVVLADDGTIRWRRRSSSMRLADQHVDETIGEVFFDRVHPDDLATVLAIWDRLRTGEISEAEFSLRGYDAADPTIVHDQDVVVIDARHVPGIGGFLACATLRDTRRAFSDNVHGDDFSLAEHAPVGLAIVSPSARIVFANHVFREQLGLELRHTLTATPVAGLHDLIDDARAVGESSRTLVHRGATLRATARRFGPGDNVVLSTSDVSAEAGAVAARVRSEQTWRATFEHAPAGIALVGTDGTFLEVNRPFASITGYEPEELVGRHFADITHEEDVAPDQEHVQALLSGEQPTYRIEKRYDRPDGRVVWVDLWVALVRDEAGEPLHFVSQILDITDTRAG